MLERVYRALLILYPPEHRREYGEQMVQLFRDRMLRDGGGYRTLVVWAHMAIDLVCSAANERFEGVRMWSLVRTAAGALLMRDYTAGKARTRKQVTLSLLLPFLLSVLFLAAAGFASLFLPFSDVFREAIFNSGLFILLGSVFLNPVAHGLVFRLRVRRDLKNSLLSLAVYMPIVILAMTVVGHVAAVVVIGNGPLATISRVELVLASYFGGVACILLVLVVRLGSTLPPAPVMTAHRYYQRAERAVSMVSLAGIAIILLVGS